MKDFYRKQVRLLLYVLETTLLDKRFALKGGTAINLFYRDFPRYSVDIDLCYLPIEDRKTTIHNIHLILKHMMTEIKKLPSNEGYTLCFGYFLQTVDYSPAKFAKQVQTYAAEAGGVRRAHGQIDCVASTCQSGQRVACLSYKQVAKNFRLL